MPRVPPDPQTFVLEQREYLFDMLSQMAGIAASCGESGIELILKTIVVSRTTDAAETASLNDRSSPSHQAPDDELERPVRPSR